MYSKDVLHKKMPVKGHIRLYSEVWKMKEGCSTCINFKHKRCCIVKIEHNYRCPCVECLIKMICTKMCTERIYLWERYRKDYQVDI